MTFVSLFENPAFNPEMIRAMDLAYDLACRALQDRGQPYIVQEVVARVVIEAVLTGERSPERLSVLALHKLGVETKYLAAPVPSAGT